MLDELDNGVVHLLSDFPLHAHDHGFAVHEEGICFLCSWICRLRGGKLLSMLMDLQSMRRQIVVSLCQVLHRVKGGNCTLCCRIFHIRNQTQCPTLSLSLFLFSLPRSCLVSSLVFLSLHWNQRYMASHNSWHNCQFLSLHCLLDSKRTPARGGFPFTHRLLLCWTQNDGEMGRQRHPRQSFANCRQDGRSRARRRSRRTCFCPV